MPYPDHVPAASTAATQESPADGAAAFTFIVANDEGLEERRIDGTVVRVLSRTPARFPRILPSGDIVFIEIDGNAHKVRILRRRHNEECVIAVLPEPSHCNPNNRLHMEDDNDLGFDPGTSTLCFTLRDRNTNMASLLVEGNIDLASGQVTSSVVFALKDHVGCEADQNKPKLNVCQALPDAGRVDPSEAVLGFSSTSLSPSGRWRLLEGPTIGNDYIYRPLLLQDTSDGLVYPIREGRWPTAIAARVLAKTDGISDDEDGLAALYQELGTEIVIGETPVYWVGVQDLLVVGALVVDPGRGVTKFNGSIARHVK
jgi:hypothetical protein